MVSCRYVGGDCSQIGEREFDEVGQRAVLSEQGFTEAVLGGAAFIEEKDYLRVGITDEEIRQWGSAGMRAMAPESFHAKLATAQLFYRELRQALKGRATVCFEDAEPLSN